jgi:hypothetical protein
MAGEATLESDIIMCLGTSRLKQIQ